MMPSSKGFDLNPFVSAQQPSIAFLDNSKKSLVPRMVISLKGEFVDCTICGVINKSSGVINKYLLSKISFEILLSSFQEP